MSWFRYRDTQHKRNLMEKLMMILLLRQQMVLGHVQVLACSILAKMHLLIVTREDKEMLATNIFSMKHASMDNTIKLLMSHIPS